LLKVTGHKRDANENDIEMASHTIPNVYHQENKQTTNPGDDVTVKYF
jgi:hypothetical protein